ncbi:MAG: hypothetical protein Tsb002_36100 [Wenzhouxiangellaceae bacterium]
MTAKRDLLDYFSLRHTQLSHLEATLKQVIEPNMVVHTKVELNLTAREMQEKPSTGAPTYQISAQMTCQGYPEGAAEGAEPLFRVLMLVHAAYRQFAGEPLSFADFAQDHSSLSRQLYPVLHHQLRPILQQLGLSKVNLPYDLVDAEIDFTSTTPPPTTALH